MEKTINTTINVGDAGYPVDVVITVWYEEDGDTITVTDSQDEQWDMDQVPNWWAEKIGEIIEESFEGKTVKI